MNETAADLTGDIQVDPKSLPFRVPTKDEILAHRKGPETENRYNLRPRDDVLRNRNIHEEQEEFEGEATGDYERSDKTPAPTPRESLAADIIADNIHALEFWILSTLQGGRYRREPECIYRVRQKKVIPCRIFQIFKQPLRIF